MKDSLGIRILNNLQRIRCYWPRWKHDTKPYGYPDLTMNSYFITHQWVYYFKKEKWRNGETKKKILPRFGSSPFRKKNDVIDKSASSARLKSSFAIVFLASTVTVVWCMFWMCSEGYYIHARIPAIELEVRTYDHKTAIGVLWAWKMAFDLNPVLRRVSVSTQRQSAYLKWKRRATKHTGAHEEKWEKKSGRR